MSDKTRGVSINDIIEHHTKAAASCEAYAKAIGAPTLGYISTKSDKRLIEHYSRRAAWHRAAIGRIEWLIRQASL